MTVLWGVVAAIGFFALIMASVALHELGHMVPAKLFGIKVPEYFIGFGRTLWSRRRGGTEYGIKAFPLGGFVKLVGMYPPARSHRRPNWLTRLADDARASEYESITSADEGHLFYAKPVWQKLIVMAGGIIMNLLLAFVILLGVNLFHGQYEPQLTVQAVSECIVPAGRADTRCQPGDPESPAARAGVRVGDRLLAFNGTRLVDFDQLSELIRANGASGATLLVNRAGREITLSTSTVVTGLPDRRNPSRTVEAGFLGVTPSYELQRMGPIGTARQMGEMTSQSLRALVGFPVKVWNVGVDMATGRARDVNGPISIVGASRVAGELAAAPDLSFGDRVASWFMMLGSVNLFVALLNVVPLPPLDGGHIAGALYDGMKRGVARLRGRPDPGHADTAMMLPVAFVVGGFLLLAGLVLVVADIFFPVKLL